MAKGVVLGMLISVAVLMGIALAIFTPGSNARQGVEWLDTPRSMDSFVLASDSGVFSNQSLQGRWTIVSFGFLHCSDVCPTGLAQLAELRRQLARQPIADKVEIVFVSVDPGRDTPADIGRYVRHFHPSIQGVTGDPQQLARLARDLGVRFKVSPDSDDYAVAHSITFSIIGPQGMFRGRFRPGFDVRGLVASLNFRV